jgi:hypothetical protein
MMPRPVKLLALALGLFGGLLGSSSAALAQDITAELTVVPQKDPKKAKEIPSEIHATIYSASAMPAAEKIRLIQVDNKKLGEIELSAVGEVLPYNKGDETLGLAVVFEVQHLWIGNADWWTGNDNSRSDGYFKPLSAALDQLGTAGPSGSKGALIAYGNGATVKWQGPLAELNGEKMGNQKSLSCIMDSASGNCQQVLGQDVGPAVGEAINLLKKMGTSRKVLIIVGDGKNAESLSDYKKDVQSNKIEVFGLYASAEAIGQVLEGDPNGWKKLAPTTTYSIEGPDAFGPKMGQVVSAIADRYYVRFPGADIKLQKAFDWDAKPHEFKLMVEKVEVALDDTDLNLSPEWKAPWLKPPEPFRWWLWFLILPIGLILLIVLLVKLLGGKKQPAPVPEPVIAAPPPVAAPAPAPMPMGSPKTVMIGIGGDDQGFPIVGWIVPLNGPNQFQTFKLQGGATRIGTTAPSHILINDGYMSTEHCQIVMSPAGFTLVDGGSTNGTYVNERKVDKHELVDNDIILMGKTKFRFKSTL